MTVMRGLRGADLIHHDPTRDGRLGVGDIAAAEHDRVVRGS